VLPGERGWWHSSAEFLKTRRFHHELTAAVAALPRPDEVVLGDYRSRECRHLASLFPAARVVLLDDGSATHQIVRYRRDPDDENLSANVPRLDWRTVRLRTWAGIALPFIHKVTFFSHY